MGIQLLNCWERGYCLQIDTGGAATEERVVGSRISPLMSRSTLVKLPEEVSRGSLPLNVITVRSPLKRAANVMFTVNESL